MYLRKFQVRLTVIQQNETLEIYMLMVCFFFENLVTLFTGFRNLLGRLVSNMDKGNQHFCLGAGRNQDVSVENLVI